MDCEDVCETLLFLLQFLVKNYIPPLYLNSVDKYVLRVVYKLEEMN